MANRYFLILISVFSFYCTYGQIEDCGTTVLEQHTTEEFVKSERLNPSYARSPVMNEVPIKIHIIGASNGVFALDSNIIFSELEIVNDLYEPANIHFSICGEINYILNTAYVNFEKTTDEVICNQEDVAGALNIYFAPNIVGADGDDICGYAYNFDIKRRLFVDNGCVSNGSTLAHELGHSFSLKHTHSTSSGAELVSGTNCETAGDLLCDTPADPKLSSSKVNDNCVYIAGEVDSEQNPYNPSTENIMSYAPKDCRFEFTNQQLTQIEAYYQTFGEVLNCGATNTPTNDLTINESVLIYPNPFATTFVVQNVPANAQLELWNVSGQSIWQTTQSATLAELEITAPHELETGIYYLCIRYNQTTQFLKVIKL